jgi:hypothetical protein
MPNLIPDWLPFMQPAGRLIWFSLAFAYGIVVTLTLIRRPIAKRPFSLGVGIALCVAIPLVTWVLAALIAPIQILIVWLGLFALAGFVVFLCATRSPEVKPTTWAEAMIGAVGVFLLMTFAYGNIPHEWITFADSYLLWSTDKFVWKTHKIAEIGNFKIFLPPFELTYQALRDVIVVAMYGAFIVLNVILFSMWQKRNVVKTGTEAAAKPKRFSRFGRPVKAGV